MKLVDCLRRTLTPCFIPKPPAARSFPSSAAAPLVKNRLSATLTDNFKECCCSPQTAPSQEEDSLIDAAASTSNRPSSLTRSVIVGTIYGHRRRCVSFCVQQDPATPPPFLFDLSIPTHRLAEEMRAGILRIALECHRPAAAELAGRCGRRAAGGVWRVYCNGRKVGYAVKRSPTEKDRAVLRRVRTLSAGAGVMGAGDVGGSEEEGEMIYMRASYERVVGSRDTVSYHLMNPGSGSPSQELSVFLLRTG